MSHGSARSAEHRLDEVESVARIGSYSLDIASGRWTSSPGLDALYRIAGGFTRSVEGWASLIHPADRDAMVGYFGDEVLGQGQPFDRQYRIIRNGTGEERWVHGRGVLECDQTGRPVRMLGTIADITEQRQLEEALRASEERYATIFNGTAEAILIADVTTYRYRWVNAAASTLLGYSRAELIGLGVLDIHPASDLPWIIEKFQSAEQGRGTEVLSVPCLRKDGSVVMADIRRSTALVDGVMSNIAFFSDATERRRLESHDRVLSRAVDQAGDGILVIGQAGEIEYANEAYARMKGVERDSLVGTTAALLARTQPPEIVESLRQSLLAGTPWTGDLGFENVDGVRRLGEIAISPVLDPEGARRFVAVIRDVTDARAREAELARLTIAFEQTSDSVIITDLAGTITYVNPAFERITGYRRAATIGQAPRILQGGNHSPAFYRALWRRLARGDVWSGTFTNRRPDGERYVVETTISPIRHPGDTISGYIGVQRDVTALRGARSQLAAEFRERATVAAALARLQPRESAEATAGAICDELLGVPGVDLATIVTFDGSGQAVTVAVSGPDGLPIAAGRRLPGARATYLYERALLGPWAEVWHARAADGAYGRQMVQAGIRAIAYAPIHNGEGLLGFVASGTRDKAYALHLLKNLPAVSEFAGAASALLSGEFEADRRQARAHKRIRRLLADRAFHPVFQPIIDLASCEAVGYEALTRFADGTPPDRMFAAAHAGGLGLDLEIACLTASLTAAEALPRDAWLSLNVSPDLILHASALPALLAHGSRPIVIEITEHTEIADYAALRTAVSDLGPRITLAVDDAGAGFASLHHIVELAPRFLKVDISLVRGVDHDLTRQAMIAGLVHFAARSGCEAIAEGIEEPAELEMLRGLGIALGQGYLLGRPGPVPPAPGGTQARARGARRSPTGERAHERSASSDSLPLGISGTGKHGRAGNAQAVRLVER